MESKNQSGFTLIELMIVVAIVGILASIVVSFASTYTARAKVSEVLSIAAQGKTGVAEFCFASGRMPDTADQAALSMDTDDLSQYIQDVAYNKVADDFAQIEYQLENLGPELDGKWIMLAGTCGAGVINWDCMGDATVLPRYLPANCR